MAPRSTDVPVLPTTAVSAIPRRGTAELAATIGHDNRRTCLRASDAGDGEVLTPGGFTSALAPRDRKPGGVAAQISRGLSG